MTPFARLAILENGVRARLLDLGPKYGNDRLMGWASVHDAKRTWYDKIQYVRDRINGRRFVYKEFYKPHTWHEEGVIFTIRDMDAVRDYVGYNSYEYAAHLAKHEYVSSAQYEVAMHLFGADYMPVKLGNENDGIG